MVQLLLEDVQHTWQLHYQLLCGPFYAKDSASVALLRQCYVPATDELVAA